MGQDADVGDDVHHCDDRHRAVGDGTDRRLEPQQVEEELDEPLVRAVSLGRLITIKRVREEEEIRSRPFQESSDTMTIGNSPTV